MRTIQLLRVSIYERMNAAAEAILQQLQKDEKAAKLRPLRALLYERLTAAAEEIVGLLQKTVSDYEDRVQLSEEENSRQREILDAVLKPEVRLHRLDQKPLFSHGGPTANGASQTSAQLQIKSTTSDSEENKNEQKAASSGG